MGTNFFILSEDGFTGNIHIGKRSAAGWYCWDCKMTLCKGGESLVHFESGWYDKCPVCGKEVIVEPICDGEIGRELGFNKSELKAKKGVKSCCSFSWAITMEDFCKAIGQREDDDKIIVNEYGDKFTISEFSSMLDGCPIKYTGSIGKRFR